MAGNGCSTHPHYQRGCPTCQRVASAYDRHRRTAITNGTWQPPVNIDTVRDHIARLRAAGMTVASIGGAARLPKSTVYAVINQPRKVVHGPTAAAILAVTADGPTLPANMVPAVATRRRIQALIADGHSMSDLGRYIDRPMQRVWTLAWGRTDTVTAETEQTVARLYDRLLLSPGHNTRARRLAARNGWVPPQAWTDTTIADSAAGPFTGVAVVDDVLVAEVLAGRRPFAVLNRGERVALWRAWEHRRRSRGETAGLSAFATTFAVGKSTAERLRAAAATSYREAA